MKLHFRENTTTGAILEHCLLAAVSLFINGFGVYLTIHADLGVGPWDVFTIGLANQLGILYGTTSVIVSFTVLFIDVLMREPIGIAMFIDAVVVGKTVDLFNYLDWIPTPQTLPAKILMMASGLLILGYTSYFYMRAALGCGPRDTLLVGIARRVRKVPIGVLSILLLSTVTFIGYLLGGPIGLGTLMWMLTSGPLMQLAFFTFRDDATAVVHQNLRESIRIIAHRNA